MVLRHVARTLTRVELALGARGLFRAPWCDPGLVAEVRRRRLTYLHTEALFELGREVARQEQRGVPGILLEAGCALGGSAVVMARCKARARPLWLFDVFDTIPAPSASDGHDVQRRYQEIRQGGAQGINGDTYYGYLSDLKDRVAENLASFQLRPAEHSIRLVQGLFEDTLRLEKPVALAHIDCDWYDSVRVALQRVWPMLSPGGRIIIDDYFHWSGCRRAVEEFLQELPSSDYRKQTRSRLHLVRL